MKVLINALFINWGINGGTETYLREMCLALDEISNPDDVFYLLSKKPPPFQLPNRFKLIINPIRFGTFGRILHEQLRLRRLFQQLNADIIWNPGYVGISFFNSPQVNTVHDAYCWTFPKEIGILRTLYWKIFIPLSVGKKTQVIAVSESTKDDLVQYTNMGSQKVATIFEGPGASICVSQAAPSFFEQNADIKFFLSVGGTKPIKNPIRLIKAFSKFNLEHDHKYRLVITGPISKKLQKFLASHSDQTSCLHLPGLVSDKELEYLYSHSLAVVFPSLGEGFGLPILEAQKRGKLVITSNFGATKEIAGGGALLANPLEVESILDCLNMALDNDIKGNVIAKGYENLERFNWITSAKETYQTFKEVIKN